MRCLAWTLKTGRRPAADGHLVLPEGPGPVSVPEACAAAVPGGDGRADGPEQVGSLQASAGHAVRAGAVGARIRLRAGQGGRAPPPRSPGAGELTQRHAEP
eukprot:scaffold339_cov402-Prasinococcus_capsulatus_cf.AAC.21